MAFAHLHLHTEYSLLDGACRINGVLDRALELGQTSVAITDHGAMYGVIDFYLAAKERGINPVIGCECYVAQRSRHDKVHGQDSERYHLVLLLREQHGLSEPHSNGVRGMDERLLHKAENRQGAYRKHHEGLIASACLAGEIPRALQRGDYEEAKTWLSGATWRFRSG